MTFDEYKQLRIYSWYDGIYLAILWTASFACLIGTSSYPAFSFGFIFIALLTPFFVGRQLKKYRNEGLDGFISFPRALSYCLRVFFNAAFLFALIQFLYMQYLDHGRLFSMLTTTLMSADTTELMKQMNMNIDEMRTAFESITPLQFSITYFIENLIIGAFLSLPIAFLTKKEPSRQL